MGQAGRGRGLKRSMSARGLLATVLIAIVMVIAVPTATTKTPWRPTAPDALSLESLPNDPDDRAGGFNVILEEKQGRATAAAKEEYSAAEVELTRSLRLRLRPATGADQFNASLPILHRSKVDRLAGVPPALTSLVTNDGADILATAYAPTDAFHADASPFDALLMGDQSGRFIPPLATGDHDWLKLPLPATSFSSEEQKCLSTAIYFEARGESLKGQAAVAQVILNRVRNPAYPDGICGVVYQNATLYNRCQFSFACDGAPERIVDRRAYDVAREIAMAVTGGKIFLQDIGSSTHYFATYVRPDWADAMEEMTQIGSHIFYRTYDGGWG